MPRKPPKLSNSSPSQQLPYDNTLTGPTPLGWTFYSTFLHCKREWWLRYVEGLLPIKKQDFFSLGEAYHALQEGVPTTETKRRYGDKIATEAQRLFDARAKGAPMAKATNKEVKLAVASAASTRVAKLFTSKPDRFEGESTIREFKTTKWHGTFDSQKWDVSPQIVGELLASGAERVIVDVISKSATPETRQYVVKLTEAKRIAFEDLIRDTVDDIERRLAGVPDASSFPCSMHACAYPSLCIYYDHCWGGGACSAALFKRVKNEAWKKALRAAGRKV